MPPDIDFTKGGYGGDPIEEMFKPYTSQHLEYWWQFREVLIAAPDKHNPFWKRIDGNPLSDEEYRELIAVSLMNYAVYTGLGEALWFHMELKQFAPLRDEFAARRCWKALYSSLYSSFTALCYLVYVVVCQKTPFRRKKKSGELWSYGPGETVTAMKAKGKAVICDALEKSMDRLEIRNHLDHYWTIWNGFSNGTFTMDRNFEKGYIAVDPANDVKTDVDAVKRADEDILYCTQQFDIVYKEMAKQGGHLDDYLKHRGWYVAHPSGQRPTP